MNLGTKITLIETRTAHLCHERKQKLYFTLRYVTTSTVSTDIICLTGSLRSLSSHALIRNSNTES